MPVVFILLFIISIYTFSKKNVKEYERTEEVFGNPLMGYAPCAWNTTVSDDVSLLYMDITWAEALCRNKRYRALFLYRKMWYNDSKIQMLRICRALRFTILSFTNSAQVSKLPCVVNL